MRTIPVKWAPAPLPNAIIVGADGFYVRWQQYADALQLCVGHTSVVGGLAQEWANATVWPSGIAPEHQQGTRRHARRMIRAARRAHPELTTAES